MVATNAGEPQAAPPSLTSRTVAGVSWNMIGTGGQMLLQFVLFIMLARALGPAAFGVVGIAAVFIDISTLIGRGGLTEVLIQQPEISEEEASTAFWTSAFTGMAFTVALFVAAGPLARLYQTAELAPVLRWLSISALIYAVGAVYEARMRRAFAFRQLAARNVSATIVSGAVSLVLALAGLGPYALVAQRLVNVSWLLAAMVIATRWRPRFRYRAEISRRQFNRGWAIALAALFSNGNQRVIDLLVGYFLGAVPLGYLRIAWRALELLNQLAIEPIKLVTLGALSLRQSDMAAFRRAYVNVVRMTAVFTYPIYLGAAVAAPEVVRLLFGRQWDQSIAPMQILALTGLFAPLFYYNNNAMIAVGRMRMVLWSNMVEFALSAACAMLFARHGLAWAAAGNVARTALITPLMFFFMWHVVGVSPTATLRAAARPVVAAAAMAALLWAMRPWMEGWAILPRFAVLAAAGAILYLAAMALIARPLLRELLALGAPLRARLPGAPR